MNIQTLRNERVTLCECVATNFYCDEKFVVVFLLVCRVNKSPESPTPQTRKGEKRKKVGRGIPSREREKVASSEKKRGGVKKKGKHLSHFLLFAIFFFRKVVINSPRSTNT